MPGVLGQINGLGLTEQFSVRLTPCRPVGAPFAPLECGCGGRKVLLVSTGALWNGFVRGARWCLASAPAGLCGFGPAVHRALVVRCVWNSRPRFAQPSPD